MLQRISLRVNGDAYRLAVEPHRTLASVLRTDLHLSGTKIGCGAGDCGACTVILDGRSVLSCLTLAVEADGCDIMTVEGLAPSGRVLHPIQQAFIDAGAIQCGFCTPGMEMSAYYLLSRNPMPTEQDVRLGLAGNLCRCTGYAKIVEAVLACARRMAEEGVHLRWTPTAASVSDSGWKEALQELPRETRRWGYVAADRVEDVCQLLAEAEEGSAVLIAGGTDVVPKLKAAAPQARPPLLIGLRKVSEMYEFGCDRTSGLRVGAMVRLAEVAESRAVRELYPAVAEGALATGTPQVRNMGTVVGNLCNAAPSADNAPALLALDAKVSIAGPSGRREVALSEFFVGPGKTVLRRGEVVVSVSAPPPPPRSGQCYLALSQRSRVDISAAGAAAFLALDEDGSCTKAGIAVGGVAPIPMRVSRAEESLLGQRLLRQGCNSQGLAPDAVAAFSEAARIAAEAARPIDDVRASASYRRRITRVLVERALGTALLRAVGAHEIATRFESTGSGRDRS